MKRSRVARGAELADRFREHVSRESLVTKGQRVVVAVSGGLDSTVLLHLMRFAMGGMGLELRAAHLDHAMRTTSRGDADWVAGLCRAWGVPLVRRVAGQVLRGEAEARTARYAFLSEVRDEVAADCVLTAHHADDQAETVLFRAVRGSGLRGLAGIPTTRDGWVTRPLLPFSRDTIEAYAQDVGLAWRTDPTNADLGVRRNVLRRVILPRLERDVAPGAARSLRRLAEQARTLDRTVSGLAEAALAALVVHQEPGRIVLARARLSMIEASARAEVLRLGAARLGVQLSRTGTRLATEVSRPDFNEGGQDVGSGLHISAQYEDLVMETRARATTTRPLRVSGEAEGEGPVIVDGRSMRARWSRVVNPGSVRLGATEALFRSEALRFPLAIREWRAGDAIRFLYGTKKVKALFQEARLPRWRRTRQPILVDADDRVLWAPGLPRGVEAPASAEERALWVTLKDSDTVES